MKWLQNLLFNSIAVFLAAYILSGVSVNNFLTAVGVALVLGLINTFLKPILIFFTLPINILSFGLFTLVINAGLVLLASSLIDGFIVVGLWSALWFSILVSTINWLLNRI